MLFKNISLLDEELNIKENMNLFVNEAEGIIEKIFPGNEEKKTEKFIYRNTVGTVTEIHDYLRLLYGSAARPA